MFALTKCTFKIFFKPRLIQVESCSHLPKGRLPQSRKDMRRVTKVTERLLLTTRSCCAQARQLALEAELMAAQQAQEAEEEREAKKARTKNFLGMSHEEDDANVLAAEVRSFLFAWGTFLTCILP